jgi:hypothetical protein
MMPRYIAVPVLWWFGVGSQGCGPYSETIGSLFRSWCCTGRDQCRQFNESTIRLLEGDLGLLLGFLGKLRWLDVGQVTAGLAFSHALVLGAEVALQFDIGVVVLDPREPSQVHPAFGRSWVEVVMEL